MSFSLFGRYDAFLLGMKQQIVSNRYKDHVKAKAELMKTIGAMSKDFRQVYDSLIPNIHAINLISISNVISNDIIQNTSRYLRNKSDFTTPSALAAIKDKANKDFVGPLLPGPIFMPLDTNEKDIREYILTESFLSTLRVNIRTNIKNLYNSVKVPEGNDPIGYLNTAMKNATDEVDTILLDPNISEHRKTTLVFNLGYRFRLEISKIFKNANLLGIDSSSVGISDEYIVFFGKSFSAMVTKINKVVNKAVSDTIESSINVKKSSLTGGGSSIGDLIHFGHSAIQHKDNKDITTGINALFNSPGFLKTAFNRVNSTSSDSPNLGMEYMQATGHLNHSLKIEKNINSTLGTLMTIGITFTQDQLAKINLGMASSEGAQGGRGLGSDLLKSTIVARDLATNILKGVFPILGDILNAEASPSLKTLIVDKILSTISGKAPKHKPKHTSGAKGTIDIPIFKAKSKTIKIPKAKLTINAGQTTRVLSPPPIRNTGGQFTSLVALQNIINQTLHAQIQKNMGTGSSKNILNYRTGRFAESAKVESMSQSREGMITAFYSYMRNPYGTFSTGGAQESPATRDPKLLISKSIREIGATMVNNRMRAVLV